MTVGRRAAQCDISTGIVDELKTAIVEAPPFDFPPGAFLVSVGTSWGFLNYFLTIRDVKRRSRIRYVPLVHDCIPLLFPELPRWPIRSPARTGAPSRTEAGIEPGCICP